MSDFKELYAIDPRDARYLLTITPVGDQWVDRLSGGRGTREDAERAICVFDQLGKTWAADHLRLALSPPIVADAIDLDLVELRCRIRGWRCQRRIGGLPEVRVATPEGGVWVAADGTYGSVPMYGRDGDGRRYHMASPAHDADADAHGRALTAPRWTLDRLLSDPPEGWTARLDSDPDLGAVVLSWHGTYDEAVASIWVEEDGTVQTTIDVDRTGTPERLALRFTEAAELALILAEVEA